MLKKTFWREVEGTRFYSLTVRGFKFEKKAGCRYVGQYAVYLGPMKSVVDEEGHLFPARRSRRGLHGHGGEALEGARTPAALYTRVMACRAADHLGVSGGTPSDAHRLLPGAALHWGAAAALSFARGVNDNAKLAAIATLGFTAMGAPLAAAFAVTAAAMTVGSYAAGLRVTRTLGERVVHMDQDTGLAAALTSAGLVLAASFHALPVSTTHVSTGAIVGSGIRQGRHAVEWRRVGGLVSAWLVTLPIAAALAALTGWLMA
jgi:hypothetical protein